MSKLDKLVQGGRSFELTAMKGDEGGVHVSFTAHDGTKFQTKTATVDAGVQAAFEFLETIGANALHTKQSLVKTKARLEGWSIAFGVKNSRCLESNPERYSTTGELNIGVRTFTAHFPHWDEEKMKTELFEQAFDELFGAKTQPSIELYRRILQSGQ
jgi:hypothetical protein